MEPFSVFLQPEAIRPDDVVDAPLPTVQSREEMAMRWADIVKKRLNAVDVRRRGRWEVSPIDEPPGSDNLGFALRAIRQYPRMTVFEIIPQRGESPEDIVSHLTGRRQSDYQLGAPR